MHVNISFTNEWTTWQLTMIPSLLKERNQHYIYIFFQCSYPRIQIDRLFFHFWNFSGYDFCPTSIWSFFSNPSFHILLLLPLLATWHVHVFPRHLGLRRTRAEAILALTPWEPKESKNLTKVASFLRPNSIQFWMDGIMDGFYLFLSVSIQISSFRNFWLLSYWVFLDNHVFTEIWSKHYVEYCVTNSAWEKLEK